VGVAGGGTMTAEDGDIICTIGIIVFGTGVVAAATADSMSCGTPLICTIIFCIFDYFFAFVVFCSLAFLFANKL
jgi:hypothetical protein